MPRDLRPEALAARLVRRYPALLSEDHDYCKGVLLEAIRARDRQLVRLLRRDADHYARLVSSVRLLGPGIRWAADRIAALRRKGTGSA